MGDLVRMDSNTIVMTSELLVKRMLIQLSEKEANIKGLELRLDDLKNIEMKKVELQIDLLEAEIKVLQEKIKKEKTRGAN